MALVVTPRSTFHQLQLNGAEGTSLEDTPFDNFKGIRHWLNVTKLYNTFFAIVHRWLYGREHREPQWQPIHSSASSWQQWLIRNGAEGTAEELRMVARDLKNATHLNRYDHHAQRVREGDSVPYTVAKAKLLSHAEYRAAEGNPATPLMGDDRFFDKVAKSGRSAALLNMDWMIRNASERTKHPPATGYLVNEVLSSVDSGEARIANYFDQKAREQRRKLKVDKEKVHMAKLIAFWEQAANRICNLNYCGVTGCQK